MGSAFYKFTRRNYWELCRIKGYKTDEYKGTDFPIALDLLASGRVAPSRLITTEIPLAEVVEGGLEEVLHHHDRHIKILVDPRESVV